MKNFWLFTLLFSVSVFSQSNCDALIENNLYQKKLNNTFSDSETSILEESDFENFTGLNFYPINLDYRVEATFVRTPDEKPFLMPTTTDRLPEYVKYGEVHFTIKEVALKLDVFQNTSPKEGYENYLFLPFTDLTSGHGSYGGGRYLDLQIPEKEVIILDFNQLYNPYCVYNKKYSCPIPPEQNDLPIKIEAGIKDYKNYP